MKKTHKTKYSKSRNKSKLLLFLGTSGLLVTSGLSAVVSRRLEKAIDEEKEHISETENIPKEEVQLRPSEYFHVCWKPCVPVVVTAAFSIGCIVASDNIDSKNNAALATAYSLSESAFNRYRTKVANTIGEEKEQIVQKEVMQEVVPNTIKDVAVINTGHGDDLFLDYITGQPFTANEEFIRHCENEVNRYMRCNDTASVNDWLYELGLNPSGIGNDIGWHVDKGYIDVRFTSTVLEINGSRKSALVIMHQNPPVYGFDSLA